MELHDELLKSSATERQLFNVIDRPYLASLIDAKTRDWLRRLMALAEPIGIVERVTACRDPTDDKFLELAHNGRADVVVTGDTDLLLLDPFRDIRIMNPAEYLRLIR